MRKAKIVTTDVLVRCGLTIKRNKEKNKITIEREILVPFKDPFTSITRNDLEIVVLVLVHKVIQKDDRLTVL